MVRLRIPATAVAALVLSTPAVLAQERATLGPDDYDRWEGLGQVGLSPDGRWTAVGVSRVSGEDELRIHRTDVDSVIAVPYGARPTFSEDGAWLAYAIGSSEDARDEARERDEPVHDDLGLLDLRTGAQETIEDVESFSFSDGGAYLAMQRYKPKDKESDGVDVVVRTMATGAVMSFGNVSGRAWQEGGSLLALTIDADGKVGNGVSVFDPGTGRLRSLDAGEATYTALSWREDAADLAVLKTFEDEQYEDTAHVALAWRGLDGTREVARRLDPRTDTYFPQAMRVVGFRTPTWSEDGATLFLGIQPRRPDPDWVADGEGEVDGGEGDPGDEDETDEEDGTEEGENGEDDDDDLPGVEIWHSLDLDPVPQQRVREDQLRRENFLSAWHLDESRFVQLGDDLTESTSIVEGGRHAIGRDESPYDEHAMFRQQFHDLYAIDVGTGAKTLVEDRVTIGMEASPGGRYLLWFEGDDYFTYDLRSGEKRNVTEGVGTAFVNLDVTPTREQMPPFGVAGWLADDQAVLLNDEWDVWEVRPDGSRARRLTNGAADSIRYRLMDLDPEEDAHDPDRPLYYTTYGEWTKKAGFARARIGDDPRMLIWNDRSYRQLIKAVDADVYAFREEAFDDSPDVFVAGPDLSDPRQVTETNPFQDEYAWGRAELVEYENEWGRRLQGALFYPADYEPGRTYPMIVYHYELLSQTLHQYQVPDPTSYYNGQIWSQEGYFVLRPDVVYRDRRPGQSNVETLRPAVAAAVATGMIDEERIGLIGHSWGGYQTTFFVTQDDLFTAAVAGAPLTNLMSMYLSFYWNSGGTDARIFEISQGRMQVPWWEDYESYRANSPLHNIQNMNTPLLMMFGTNDGAVEYNQGVEFYNAARRLGKNMVMLSYDGENHGLAEEPNQRDYHGRILQWFAHYLKGEPAPDWISKGVPYIEQKDGLKTRRPIG
jgi:dipeptidyl aminopeptidase/acylaminoacyl peptidase